MATQSRSAQSKGILSAKFICMAAAAVFVFSCSSRNKNTDTVSSTPLTNGSTGSGVDSTPMSFDVQGSDSGKIDGLQSINFDYDKAAVTSASKQTLKSNADWMKKNTKAKVQIEGHCDSRGSIEYNLALGERRAKAVREYMISLGVSGSRLSTISYGKERPLVQGESEEAWAKNRRANFVPSM